MSDRLNAMKQVCQAQSPHESYLAFKKNKDLLEDCKFIFTTKGPSNIPLYVREKTFSNGAGIHNIFMSERIIVLDEFTINEMERTGNVDFTIDSSLALDTMAVSYLKPYLNNQEHKLPRDFKEIFEYLAREDVNIDPMPYIIENLGNMNDSAKINSIFNILKSYEVLKDINLSMLQKDGIIATNSNNQEVELSAKTNLDLMKVMARESNVTYIYDIYNVKYCLLLKMILIHIEKPQNNVNKKLLEFIEFCHKKLKTLSMREIVIAKEYFKRGQNLTFFGKIQKGNRSLISNIRNMAWDLYHIVNMERSISQFPTEDGDFFIPAFLTFDKRLIEIMKLYHIKSIGYSTDGKLILPAFEANDFFADLDSSLDIKKYFSKQATIERENNRSEKVNTKQLIEHLEEDIKQFM